MRLILAALLLVLPAATLAQSCPKPLAGATRLVLVTSDKITSDRAALQRFTRASPQGPWRADGGPVTAMLGRNGMAWGYAFHALARPGEPVKVEGDKRAPMGFYKIGASFGFAPASRPNHLQISQDTVCVDDVTSASYSEITSRRVIGPRVHAENMGRVPEYRHGLLVDYPTSRTARGGSCIFIHLWPSNRTGTGGCVALPEPQLLSLQNFVQSGAVLAILPQQVRARFKGCLP